MQSQLPLSIILRILPLVFLILLSGCPIRSAPVRQSDHEPPRMNSTVPVSGQYYSVTRDDNLTKIARKYGTTVRFLAELNNIKPPYVIREGMKIFIPGSGLEKAGAGEQAAEQPVEDVNDTSKLSWPVKGEVVSEFGVRDGAQHNGIIIGAPDGTPVVAAADGRVGYVGSIAGYGKVILIEHPDHPDRLVTVYAHLKDTRTENGKRIKRSETIGAVGTSGRVNSPSLYFEVRSESKPRNPVFFLDRDNKALN